MAKAHVLARVARDLAAGQTHVATQRLRSLVAAFPGDVEIHRHLADVYRRSGNLVEAGRWGFVTAEVTAEELAAFERAHPSPWVRLRLICWGEELSAPPHAAAAERLIALRAQAAQAGPPEHYVGPIGDTKQPSTDRFPCLFIAIVLFVLGLVAAIAAYQLAHFILY